MVRSAYNIIKKKRDGFELSIEELEWMVSGLISSEVANYQFTAFLMAIYFNGLTKKETAALTNAMLYSGKTIKFKDDKNIVDKHSTGGVGDKTSFIVAPLAAACGVQVPMIAGRGLGHTGGTIDKIESIKGFHTNLSFEQFKKNLEGHGIVLMGQTEQIAPADKIIYSLRDVTATIDSIPLITASIMSKKLAEGASGIVMDIKVGNGAFMQTLSQAKKLARSIRQTGERFNRSVMTVISDMNQPLGMAVGNSLEIIESVETLKNQGPKDLTDLSLELAGGMIYLAGKSKSHSAGIKKAKTALKSGEGLEKFKLLIESQGGSCEFFDDYTLLPTAPVHTIVTASKKGIVKKMDVTKIGQHIVSLGGGRRKANDQIDPAIGFTFHQKLGDSVKKDSPLLTIHHHGHQTDLVKSIAKELSEQNINIGSSPLKKEVPLIYESETLII